MAELINASKRQLIPRWHTSRKIEFIRPLIYIASDNEQEVNRVLFRIEEKKQVWKSTSSITSAIDLFVSLNLANLPLDPLYEQLKNHLLSKSNLISDSVRNLVKPRLRKLDVSDNYTTDKERVYQIIRTLKIFLKDCSHDSLSWNDLAFYYAVIGERDKSEHCMRVGFNLQPNHPFLARSYARLLVHYDAPDKALYILKKNRKETYHPEILSADIAIRRAFEIGSPDITTARRLISKYSNQPHCISELSASLGTIEAENGSIKKAKGHLTTSALAPTENTIAQLQWISQQHNIYIPINKINVQSLEANAISSYNNKNYPRCRDELMMLHKFQPFSEGALVDAGYLSMVALDDPEFVCGFSEYFGNNVLDSFRAKNNYIAAKLTIGDLNNIEKMLIELRNLPKDDREKAVLSATMGMYLYRIGEYDRGRKHYENTNTFFKHDKDYFSLALSLMYQGLIEKKLSISSADSILRQAEKEAKKAPRSPELLDKIKRELGKQI